jgi:hypothetical protein
MANTRHGLTVVSLHVLASPTPFLVPNNLKSRDEDRGLYYRAFGVAIPLPTVVDEVQFHTPRAPEL